jgi:hypothetical protein
VPALQQFARDETADEASAAGDQNPFWQLHSP